MANLRRYGSGPYHLELRFAGRKFQRSLHTTEKDKATRVLAVVEQTVEYLEAGVYELPDGTSADDLWRFLISGGKASPTPDARRLNQTKREESTTQRQITSAVAGVKLLPWIPQRDSDQSSGIFRLRTAGEVVCPT